MFKKFNEAVQQQFELMAKKEKLFKSSISGKEVWECYLNSFEDNDNPVFRDPESSSHNCNSCNNFIRRYGNIVSIDENGNLTTLFSDLNVDEPYKVVAESIDLLLKSSVISGVFLETFTSLNGLPYEKCTKTQSEFQLGVASNFKQYNKEETEMYGVVKEDEVKEFHHFNLKLPSIFVDNSGASIESLMAKYRDKYSVFTRAMKEIPLETLNLVRDLINQGSLLDGTAHLHSIEEIITLKKDYEENQTNNWLWSVTHSMDERTAKFKNTLVGVLCTELAEGEELNKACTNWNKRVDPVNYHKASAPITQRQIQDAQNFVIENGYESSFNRRLATIDDIKASEILHINSGDGKIKEVSMFDNIKPTSTRHKRSEFDNIEEVSIDKFMSDVLPSCTSIEAYFKNNHEGNLVALTTSKNEESKPIFKWNNNYSWTFNGNLAGKSQIKDAVQSHGGKVDGVLRFSIMWAENDPSDNSDLDAHCVEPDRNLISYPKKGRVQRSSGMLDVDITNPQSQSNKNVVENITYADISKMQDGDYEFIVNQYANRGSKGFKAEIEFEGNIYSYEYNKSVSGNVTVAYVSLKNGEFAIKHKLPETNSTKEYWGLETNNFQKVNLVCLSPNHWGDNQVGNKHYLFMIDGCKSPSSTRGFHNENLLPDLLKHRKVMEVIGSTNMIESNGVCSGGIGFNSTVRDELVVKCSGSFKRMLKIKF